MNKVVLITGASRGIGRSIAFEFAKNGYDLIVNYNKSDKDIESLRKEIKEKYNVKCLPIKFDVSNENEVIDAIGKIVLEFPNIDVVVNNAGIAIDNIFMDKTVDDFKKILDVNLIGIFIVCKNIYKYINKGGSIINISSTNGIDTNYTYSMDYDASKAGVISLTKNLALEFAPDIRVNTVAPGWVLTETNKTLDDEFINEEKKKIILDRFAEPYEIAKVVCFLASDEASYVNSSVIRVDGGFR